MMPRMRGWLWEITWCTLHDSKYKLDAAMVDLTNPAARKWFKSILHDMVKTGVHGWMADFGESLPFDSCLYSGEDPATAHNKYPELWAELNREFLEEWEKEHKVQRR
ncbi:unnamed protein product [Sphagnum compactum]